MCSRLASLEVYISTLKRFVPFRSLSAGNFSDSSILEMNILITYYMQHTYCVYSFPP